jgi:S1-C subfamily serine protease
MKALIIAAMICLFPFAAQAQKKVVPVPEGRELATHVDKAVVLLYRQDESGGMHFLCTATGYRVIEGGYRFVSAAHCVEGDTDRQEKQIKFYITNDNKDEKNFIQVKLIEAGDKKVGDDFSIFEVKTKDKFDVIPLGDNSKLLLGDRIINVASPMGLGKQYFEGYVSSLHIDRPPLDAGVVEWTEAMLVVIGSGPGSSGSSLVSVDQKAIVGFIVGGMGQANIGAICVPVDKFKAF